MENNRKGYLLYLRKEKIIEIVVGIILFFALFVWGMVQPIGNQPDEHCRYLLPCYIMTEGKLPNGYDLKLLIGTYGISYGFFPGLPYIFMALFMRITCFFTVSPYALLMSARVVNMLAAVVTYVYVRKTSKRLFEHPLTAWFFTLVICFWPQVMFIFTYVNCDGFAFMSVAIMSYALIRGLKDGWSPASYIQLAVGMAVCLLSYYNAYGVIVGAAVVFAFSFFTREKEYNFKDTTVKEGPKVRKKLSFDWKNFLKYGFIILGITFLLAGWWFIRNYILYDGDLFGLSSNAKLAEQYASDIYKPSLKVTLQNSGNPIYCLALNQDFRFLLKQSFFARFGNMDILAPNYIIRGFKIIMLVCILGLFIPNRHHVLSGPKRFGFNLGMLIGALITFILTYWYSYANDYQPQGRYLLPGLIPLMCVIFMGIQNITYLVEKYKYGKIIMNIVYIVSYIYIALVTVGCILLIWSQYGSAFSDTLAMVF